MDSIGDIMKNLPPMEEPENQSEQPQSPENAKKGYELWKRSGISKRHLNFKPEDSTNIKWTEKWEAFKDMLGNGILTVILGTRGSGKTQMAVCAIRESCKSLKSAKYIKAFDFFLDVRKTYKQDALKTEHDILKEYCEPFLLVIDAIENRSESEFENLLLNHLIDIRYDQCKDTILISNQDENGFAKSMGLSVVDRIHECGAIVECKWPSMRA